MFDKIGQLAEAAATHVSVSRRGFLGRFGQVALGAAGVVSGLSTLAGRAQASSKNLYLCEYTDKSHRECYLGCGVNPLQICGGPCPTFKCCELRSRTIIGTC
jgi:hypothetical protein